MLSIRTGLVTGLLIALAAPVAHADVRVRAEGWDGTVVNTTVPRTGDSVTRSSVRNGETIVKTCAGTSAAGALDRAVKGDFDADAYSFGLLITRVKAVSLDGNDRYWGFDYNSSYANNGLCDTATADGDEVLLYAACGAATTDCFTGLPLDVGAPANATTGQPFTVTVLQHDDSKPTAPTSPAAGATVTGGAAPVTTDADGKATVTVARAGTVTLTATKGQQVRDEATVVVTAPGQPTPTPTPGATPTAEPDTKAPRSTLRGIEDGRVFKHRKRAPRKLRFRVRDASGLRAVEIGLTRRRKGACTQFSDAKGRFVKGECGEHPRFPVGTDASFSYLLPERLGPGRYTVTMRATDASGNRERLADERNRVVFYVR